MSGVRVKNAELLAMGLTLPGFIERSQVIASLPSLSLLTLAAHTPERWSVEYREIDELRPGDSEGGAVSDASAGGAVSDASARGAVSDAAARIIEGGFDVVAISSLSTRILDAYALADELRRAGVTVVLGGLHASALPEEAMQHADAVVKGEGEPLWSALLEDFEEGHLRPLYALPAGRPAFSLKDARVPRYDLLDVDRYNRIPLQTTRGCPLACTFCAASRTISSYKRKPIEQIRSEIEAILALWPKPFVELADDNTFVDKAWSRELAALLGEFAIPWFTETDISVADDEDLLDALARSNCAELLIGLESVETASLVRAEPRRYKASERPRYAEKIRRIQDRGIPVNGCFVLGFDEDDPGIFERTLEFARACELAEVQITILTPFPGTALYKELARAGRLLRPVYWDACTLFDVTFTPARMSADELEQGFRWLMRELYSPLETAKRRRIFRRVTRGRLSKLRAEVEEDQE
jgi:radical SAM superfamily enzyme YgiQ (UPF0313 family)